ncbi:hypothetical protein NR798_46385 [Archangium gephyra]
MRRSPCFWDSPNTGVIPYADMEERMEIAYMPLHPELLSNWL